MPKFSDYPVAPSCAGDDYLLIDGATNKTRRIAPENILGSENKEKFVVIDNPNQATKSDTIYYTGDGLIFVVVQSTAGYVKLAMQYRFSLITPSIWYRSCQIANNVVTNSGDWENFYDTYRDGIEQYVEVPSSDDATQNGTIYKTSNNEICFVSKSASSARQYKFDFATGSISTRTASVSDGNMYNFSNWVDIVASVTNTKMDLITSDVSVPYDYDNDKPDVYSEVFISLLIGQVFISKFYDGNNNINTYWRKISATNCEPIVGKMNGSSEEEYYTKQESDAKYATQATANVKMFLPNNTTQMDVPANLDGTGPNTAGSDFARLSIGQIFRCVLNGDTTYWIKQSASICKRIDTNDVYTKAEISDILSDYCSDDEIDALFDYPILHGYTISIVDSAPPTSTRTNINGAHPTLDTHWIWIDVDNKSVFKATSVTLTSHDNIFNYYDVVWAPFFPGKMDLIPTVSGTSEAIIPASIPVGQIFLNSNIPYIRDSSAPQVGGQLRLAKYSDVTNALGDIETLLSQV